MDPSCPTHEAGPLFRLPRVRIASVAIPLDVLGTPGGAGRETIPESGGQFHLRFVTSPIDLPPTRDRPERCGPSSPMMPPALLGNPAGGIRRPR